MKSKLKITSQVLKSLESQLGQLLPPSLRQSQLFVDLVDIHGVCRVYLKAIDKLLSKKRSNLESMENILYEIDNELFEHLPYHLKSLKKLLPQTIHALQKKKKIKK